MKLKIIIASVLILSACCYKAGAQQIFTTSEYIQNNFLYNPAAAGAGDNPSIGMTYRKQWAGIDGGPQTFIAYGDKYFADKKTGVGISLYSDKTGPTSQTGGQVDLSYSVVLKDSSQRLMFGLGGQVLQYGINKNELSLQNPGDPLLSAPSSEIKGDAAAGIYYRSSTLDAGFSVEQLIQAKLNFLKTSGNEQGKLYRHYYFTADYNWRTDEDNVLVPNFIVQYLPNAPTDVQGGVMLEHRDMLWIGFNAHYQQSFGLYAGVKIDHCFSIGYAYEEFNTPVSSFDNGGASNELSLRYFFIK
jgi:type IX secretion system PorP/SprF family membrane protein